MQPCYDGQFQILERINDNIYKVDLPSEYDVSTTYKVTDFSLFNIGFDLRSNLFEKKNDDADQPTNTIEDPLYVPIGPITRSKRKTLKEAMNRLIIKVLARVDFGDPLEHQ